MRGVYTVNYRISALAAARTLCYVTVASGKPVELLSTEVSNESNEVNEQLMACWQRITTLGTPTATTVTPAKHEYGDQAAASTWKANVTASEPTYGAIAQGGAIVDALGLKGFPSLGSYLWAPAPEERPLLASGDSWGLRLVIGPSSAADINLNCTFRELA
jgi:hypothetical protein